MKVGQGLLSWTLHLVGTVAAIGLLYFIVSSPANATWTRIGILLMAVASWVSTFRVELIRYGPGHCSGCGYSLAGLEGKPCPECGRAAG